MAIWSSGRSFLARKSVTVAHGAQHTNRFNPFYRPVTLSCLFSTLFEHAISVKINHLLWTDELQFGFKPKHSTTHALYVLNETVDYYVNHGSNVYVTFLDCSKAFDKLSHYGLFLKLIERGVPLCFINILVYWLSNLTSKCRWVATLSEPYPLLSGVKQGGILSPALFIVFINDLILLLRKKGMGCHVKSLFVGSIMFADDLALCAPSRHAMQTLISICESYCTEYGLSFNTRKTKSLIFGHKFHTMNPTPLILNAEPIEYVQECKYHGCLIESGKRFSYSCKLDLSSFRRSVNSIVRAIRKPSDEVTLRLLYTFSIPILTYASEVKQFSYAEMHACNTAVNDAIRLIFQYNRWESIRFLREQFGYSDLYTLFAKRKKAFTAKIPHMGNQLVLSLSKIVSVMT